MHSFLPLLCCFFLLVGCCGVITIERRRRHGESEVSLGWYDMMQYLNGMEAAISTSSVQKTHAELDKFALWCDGLGVLLDKIWCDGLGVILHKIGVALRALSLAPLHPLHPLTL